MSKIRIKHFGPIKEGFSGNDGWMDIDKVTVFIGNQGSGKSTVAKLISTCVWIEKALVRGDYKKKWFEEKNRFKNHNLAYHRIENYLSENSEIEYVGEAFSIAYKKGEVSINEVNDSYPLPQIMYVPAERNFLSYVKKPSELRLSSASLLAFLAEFDNAKDSIKEVVRLPINDVDLEYDKLNDTINLKGSDYKVRLTEASSGFQSLVPLFIVTRYLSQRVKEGSEGVDSKMNTEEMERFKNGVASIWADTTLTEEQRRIALSALSAKFNKTVFVNIIEEPEQNLFPASQWQMMASLLEYNNLSEGNKLIITTHSPYLVNSLSIAIQGQYLKNKMQREGSLRSKELMTELNKVISVKSLIGADSVVIYQCEERGGKINRLSMPMGIPSDRNYLNDMLKAGNQMFDKLLEIEENL